MTWKNRSEQNNYIKLFSILVFGLFLLNFLATFVSAQASLGDLSKTVIKYLVGDWDEIKAQAETVNLISKFLIMLIIFFVIVSVVKEIDFLNKNSWMAWVISGILVFLGSKFVSTGFLVGLFLPTGAILITLSVTLQFFMIVEINRKIFKNSYFFSWLTWTLWGFFLIGMIAYFSGSSLFGIRELLGWEKPSITLSNSLIITYLAVAILSIAGVTTKVQLKVNKIFFRGKIKDTASYIERAAIYNLLERQEEILNRKRSSAYGVMSPEDKKKLDDELNDIRSQLASNKNYIS